MALKAKLNKKYVELIDLYRPYFPALVVPFGALITIVSTILSVHRPGSNLFQICRIIIGPLILAVGTFYAAHRGIKSSHDAKERDKKLIELQNGLINHNTGGNSFCYLYPVFNNLNTGVNIWSCIDKGEYHLNDINIRICDLKNMKSKPIKLISENLFVNYLFKGRAATISSGTSLGSEGRYNIFFSSRNGSWTQEIRWETAPGKFYTANRVVRDGEKIDNPLLLDVSAGYPQEMPLDKSWN